jgi:Fic family protein
MDKHIKKKAVLSILEVANRPMGLPEIMLRSQGAGVKVPERTLRRWLVAWSSVGQLRRTGQKRGTKYRWANFEQPTGEELKFTQHLPFAKRKALLSQLRDLWTQSSLVLEGVSEDSDTSSSLTISDTHAILELGLTVGSKPVSEHQLVVGHARAIELLFGLANAPLSEMAIFELHKSVKGGSPMHADIDAADYQPIGAWKPEPNYLSSVTTRGEAVLIEYAAPEHIKGLMQSLIRVINSVGSDQVNIDNAHMVYAQAHLGIAHIAPFADANGQIARLVSNIPLLKAGLPPLLIDQNRRREYLELLADYQSKLGQLTEDTGIWPDDGAIVPFAHFCRECYDKTLDMFA